MVRDGTWTGTGNKDLSLGGKAITVTSESGPANCIIDCEGSGRGFYLNWGETNATIVDGFTITNGYAADGGGIYCNATSANIMNCLIDGNTALTQGGGIRAVKTHLTVTDCTISNNTAEEGGGVYFNHPGAGSGIHIEDCVFDGNSAIGAAARGGGIFCYVTNSILWYNFNRRIVTGTDQGCELIGRLTPGWSSSPVQRRATHWLRRIARKEPGLLPHWKFGVCP